MVRSDDCDDWYWIFLFGTKKISNMQKGPRKKPFKSEGFEASKKYGNGIV